MQILIKKLIQILQKEFPRITVDAGILREAELCERLKEQGKYEKAKMFFDGALCDSDEVTDLISSVSGNKGFIVDNLPLKRTDLIAFLKEKKITLNQFLTSVFAYTLSRFTGFDKSLFCLIEDGRGRGDLDDSLGMFVKTIPLLVDCKSALVSEYLNKTKNLIVETMKYDFYPFRTLAKDYNITSNITFQYSHDIRNGKYGVVEIEELEHDLVSELSINVYNDENDRLSIKVEHSKKYSDEICKKIILAYKKILTGFLSAEKLSEIDYTEKEDIEYLDALNKTETELKYKDILEAFKESIEKYPNNKLVSSEGASYTYKESVKIINGIANGLKENGIEEKSNVTILVERSHWYLLCALGVLTNGNAYVPIDDSYPNERISFMIKDTSSCALFVTNKTIDRAKEIIQENDIQIKVINVDEINYDKAMHDYVYTKVEESDTAILLYTSGTTGKPKGTLITRKAIINLATWYVNATHLTANDVYGMYTSYVFDIHTVGLYAPILIGASLDVVPEKYRLDLKKLNEYFVSHKCTHTYITSQVGKLFAQSGFDTTIKLLCFGGMKLGHLEAPDSIGPFESYGPTENLAISTYIYANKRSTDNSIGRYLYNTKGYVLDSSHRRVPIGAIGELYLSGYQLAKGYLNREEETEKAFLDNPFDGDKFGYEKMYKTGDMVRVLPDGTLGFIGRKDAQVKIRGNRVELGEVETCIRQINYVEDTTVLAIENNNSKELVAYVVLDKGYSYNKKEEVIEQIKNYVSRNKPSYMIPAFVEIIDKIPLNVNGKVDKKALPKVVVITNGEIVKPRTELEKTLHMIICSVLELDKDCLGINTPLKNCGLDSLSAIKISFVLQQKYGVNSTALELLQGVSIEDITRKIETCDTSLYHVFSEYPKDKRLVFIHPGRGGAESYLNLFKFIKNEISFTCIEHFNLNHFNKKIRGYKNVANLYVDILKEIQPEGPYYLGGWSYGGNIAYEMACILKSRGEVVRKVYMIDSFYWENTLNDSEIVQCAEIFEEEYCKTEKFLNIVKGLPEDVTNVYKENDFNMMVDELRYIPSYYDGDIYMFKATVVDKTMKSILKKFPKKIIKKFNLFSYIGSSNGYKKYAKKINIKKVPFEHFSLMDEKSAEIIANSILKDWDR